MIAAHLLRHIEKLASNYGITLCTLARRTPEDGEPSPLNGPNNHAGLNIEQRTVFIGPTAEFHHVVHEIAHIVTAPPGVDYETVPEDFVLLQLERCWVSSFELSDRVRDALIDWQLETVAPLIQPDIMLGDVWDYEESEAWNAGFVRARQLGLVDDEDKPTFLRPIWSAELLAEVRTAVTELAGTL